jgi:hypothetical protein
VAQAARDAGRSKLQARAALWEQTSAQTPVPNRLEARAAQMEAMQARADARAAERAADGGAVQQQAPHAVMGGNRHFEERDDVREAQNRERNVPPPRRANAASIRRHYFGEPLPQPTTSARTSVSSLRTSLSRTASSLWAIEAEIQEQEAATEAATMEAERAAAEEMRIEAELAAVRRAIEQQVQDQELARQRALAMQQRQIAQAQAQAEFRPRQSTGAAEVLHGGTRVNRTARSVLSHLSTVTSFESQCSPTPIPPPRPITAPYDEEEPDTEELVPQQSRPERAKRPFRQKMAGALGCASRP